MSHTQTDTSPAAIEALLKDVTPGPWEAKAQGGSSTVLTQHMPPRNDTRCRLPYGYSGDSFCVAYTFIEDDGKSFRNDFVCFSHADARFIAAARVLVPALAAELTTARQERDEALLRESALLANNEAERKTLVAHNARHAAEAAALRGEVARLKEALKVTAGVLQAERTRSGGQPFTGVWSMPAIGRRVTVSEALDEANAALTSKGGEG